MLLSKQNFYKVKKEINDAALIYSNRFYLNYRSQLFYINTSAQPSEVSFAHTD